MLWESSHFSTTKVSISESTHFSSHRKKFLTYLCVNVIDSMKDYRMSDLFDHIHLLILDGSFSQIDILLEIYRH